MKKNSKKTANIAPIATPIVNVAPVETPPVEVITEPASVAEVAPIVKPAKASKNKKVGIVSTTTTKVAEIAAKVPKTASPEISSVDKAHLTVEQIAEAAEAKLKIDTKQAKYKRKMENYRKNVARREEGKRISLERLSINNTIPNSDKKAHPDVSPANTEYVNAANLVRKEHKAKLKAEKVSAAPGINPHNKEERKAAGLKTRAQLINEIKLKSGKTVAERLVMLGDRRANRMNIRLKTAQKVTEVGKENLAQFIESQKKRNEKRGYVKKSTFHTAAQKEAIKAQVASRKAVKAAKPLQFKVEGETTNEYMAICTFVRPSGAKLLQKKYWYASNKDGADPKLVLQTKVQKIFDSLESKNGTRSIVFESINVYPNFGKDMGECVTNMIASEKHIIAKLNTNATAMPIAA